MSLKGQITNDMKTALKAGDKDRLKVVRLAMAAIKQIEVDTREELDDAATLAVITKMVKQRRDSIEQYENGGREDLAAIERDEIVVLESYLPEQLSADELTAMVDEVIAATGAASIK
ncbi:MAG: GatB/YqeY domain-containing protein, partial [Pseudomonadota bacterium]